MASFEECIEQRYDITAYQPASEEEVEEFIKLLSENHRMIHQCSRDAGFRIESNERYKNAIETDLREALNALRKGHFVWTKPGSTVESKVEQAVRYADHIPAFDITWVSALGGAMLGIGGMAIVIETLGIAAWLCPPVGMLLGFGLATLYVYYRK